MPITKEQHDAAIEVLRKEYFDSLRGWAEEIKKELAAGKYDNRESLIERIKRMVDSSRWVIYSHANKQVLLVSPHPDAYAELFGDDGLVRDGTVDWAVMAFCAVEEDLIEMLGDIGVDVDDPFPEDDDEDEEGDDEEDEEEAGEDREEDRAAGKGGPEAEGGA